MLSLSISAFLSLSLEQRRRQRTENEHRIELQLFTNLMLNRKKRTIRTRTTWNYLSPGSQVKFSCSILSSPFCSFQHTLTIQSWRSFIGACLVSIPFVNFDYYTHYIGYLIEHKNNISPFPVRFQGGDGVWIERIFFCALPHRLKHIDYNAKNCVCAIATIFAHCTNLVEAYWSVWLFLYDKRLTTFTHLHTTLCVTKPLKFPNRHIPLWLWLLLFFES